MTDEEKKAIEANAQAIALEEEKKKKEAEEAAANAETPEQKKIKELEAEKAKLIEEGSNYKVAYLKEKKKNGGIDPEETEDEKMRRIAREVAAENRINAIDSEKEALLQKTLRENKELKLAIQNKAPGSSTAGGGSSEQPEVKSTLVTEEQLAAFKARGWTDKDIERYKKNLLRYKV